MRLRFGEMFHQEQLLYGQYVFGKGWPRLLEMGLAGRTMPTRHLFVVVVLRHLIVFGLTDAGYGYGIDAMVAMVQSRFLFVLAL